MICYNIYKIDENINNENLYENPNDIKIVFDKNGFYFESLNTNKNQHFDRVLFAFHDKMGKFFLF